MAAPSTRQYIRISPGVNLVRSVDRVQPRPGRRTRRNSPVVTSTIERPMAHADADTLEDFDTSVDAERALAFFGGDAGFLGRAIGRAASFCADDLEGRIELALAAGRSPQDLLEGVGDELAIKTGRILRDRYWFGAREVYGAARSAGFGVITACEIAGLGSAR